MNPDWPKRFLATRDERDVLEAVDRLMLLAPRKFTTRDIWVVSGVPWWKFWRALRCLRGVGAIARIGKRSKSGWWEITERGKIALAIQRGCEARAHAIANRRESVLNGQRVDAAQP